MDSTRITDARQTLSLVESLDGECLKLPFVIMRAVGPAVQTLGGLLKVTNKSTFRQAAEIAAHARLPVATVRKHLVRLHEVGWIVCKGRERTRAGHLRRTATIHIPKATRDQLSPYGVLPWWACCTIRRVGRLPWSSRAVLAVVMGQLMRLKAVVERQDDYNAADWAGQLDNLGGKERFAFSLGRLVRDTGLTRQGIIPAKKHLQKLGIVNWTERKREDGGDDRDLLVPNWDFQIIITAAGEGRCYLDFR